LYNLLISVEAVLAFALGLALVLSTLGAATKTFVLPRAANVRLTRVVFRSVRLLFNLRLRRVNNYRERDRIMALYAPVTLLLLPIVWLSFILAGYMGMFWALGVRPWQQAFFVSGSSLLTLGFAAVDGLPQIILAFSEAMIGLGFVALLIAYLPTMYSAFSRREALVALLDVYAGSPPSAIELLTRVNRIRGLEYLGELWQSWEEWFAQLDESHTSLAALAFFRSPQMNRSWVTAAGTVLDAAALSLAAVDLPFDPRAALCIRAGYLALRHIADYFRIPFDPDPQPDEPVSITREEFEQALDELARRDVPLKEDRIQAWRDYAGWRVNYDAPLLSLAALVMAPPALWSSDRGWLPANSPGETGLSL
jgi:hypothetical protein